MNNQKDPLEELNNHLKEVKRYDEIEDNLLRTKSSIEENSDDYKFFLTALGGCVECFNAIAKKVLNKKSFNNIDIGYFEDMGGLINMMIDHIFKCDKSKYEVLRSYDKGHMKHE